jgi:hypothetical protein
VRRNEWGREPSIIGGFINPDVIGSMGRGEVAWIIKRLI